MSRYLVDFSTIPWVSPLPDVRHKLHQVDARTLRLVEYSQIMEPHWCERGHIGHIVEGRMKIEFKEESQIFEKDDAVFIPPGARHAHRATALTATVTALFVEDA